MAKESINIFQDYCLTSTQLCAKNTFNKVASFISSATKRSQGLTKMGVVLYDDKLRLTDILLSGKRVYNKNRKYADHKNGKGIICGIRPEKNSEALEAHKTCEFFLVKNI